MRVDLEGKTLRAFLACGDKISGQLIERSAPPLQLVQEVEELIRLEAFGGDIELDPLPGVLAMNSYYSFLAAVRIALSGQTVAVFPLVRHSVEFACYAYAMATNPDLASVWLGRHDSEDHMKACRKAFGPAVSEVAKSLRRQQEPLGNLVEDFYQASIDYGAHPNPKSILASMSFADTAQHIELSLDCLYGADDQRLAMALVACAEAGIICAFVTAMAAKSHVLTEDDFDRINSIYQRVHETVEQVKGSA